MAALTTHVFKTMPWGRQYTTAGTRRSDDAMFMIVRTVRSDRGLFNPPGVLYVSPVMEISCTFAEAATCYCSQYTVGLVTKCMKEGTISVGGLSCAGDSSSSFDAFSVTPAKDATYSLLHSCGCGAPIVLQLPTLPTSRDRAFIAVLRCDRMRGKLEWLR